MPFETLEIRRLLASVAGKVFYDNDLNGRQDAGESGMSQWVVFFDSNNNGVVDGSTFTGNSTNSAFPINDRTTYNIPITIHGASGNVADVDVRINLTHTYLSDLDISLTAPNGTKVALSTDNGGAFDDLLNTVFDDDAMQRITTIAGNGNTGRYRPEASMGAFHGASLNGTWNLEVIDDSLGDGGTFINWGLTLRNGEPDATTWSDGTYLLETSASGTQRVRPLAQSGFSVQRESAIVDLPWGGAVTDVNFGVRLPPSNIAGRVFNDLNASGSQEGNEQGLSGRIVYLDANNNGQLDTGEMSVSTNENGDYYFAGVRPQTHYVRTVVPGGWQQTTPVQNRVGSVGLAQITTEPSEHRDHVPDQLVVGMSDRAKFASQLKSRANASLFQSIDYSSTQKLSDSVWVLKVREGLDPAKLIARVEGLQGVSFADLNYVYRRSDVRESSPTEPPPGGVPPFQTQIETPGAWGFSRGKGVKVAVIDDGVLLNHPNLAPNIWVNEREVPGNGVDDDGNGYVDDRHGWDFTNSTGPGTGDNNPNPEGADTHGTHVAGVIAGRSGPLAGVQGVADEATIIPIRFFGRGAWTSTVIYNAYKYAADVGAKIVNVSYNVDGFVEAADPTFLAAVEYLDSAGVVHINSAGNENRADPPRTNIGSTVYVAAVDGNDKKVVDSNYGYNVDLAAPGSAIVSTTSNFGNASVGAMTGTSVAAAVASGVATLVWAAFPSLTRDQVVARLVGTADNIDAKNPTHSGLLGGGRVNAYSAMLGFTNVPTIRGIVGLPADGTSVLSTPTSFTVRLSGVLDPASANDANNWQLVNAGSDGVFDTVDDTPVPLSRSTYRIASNSMTFTMDSSLLPGSYRFIVRSGLQNPHGLDFDGNGDGFSGDDATITFAVAGLSDPHIVTPEPGATSQFLLFGQRQVVGSEAGPNIVRTELTLDSAMRFRVVASSGTASMNPGAVTLRNTRTGEVVPSHWYWTHYDPSARTMLVQLNGGRVLADGPFQLVLAANGVVNGQGVPMATNYVFDFSFNRADFNRDGSVNFDDLLILAQRYGNNGIFSQGDSNFDGLVNFDDLLALAQRYGQPAVVTDPSAKRHATVREQVLS